jgi:N6-L-threonylcarbamoyladenine synthase
VSQHHFVNSKDKKDIYILGIESSCDETAASVIHYDKVLSNIVASQAVHQFYGGVVPELASRAHQQKIIPVIAEALSKANIGKEDLSAIAFTKGPGLMGALLVGVSFAKAFALALDIPLIDVHHMQAHVLAHFIKSPPAPQRGEHHLPSHSSDKNPSDESPSFGGVGEAPSFPFLCLTVSGGHTQIVLVKDYLDLKVIGETRDDAAGEAFDKAAKIMGIPYPGGPMIDKLAKEGNAEAFKFPHPQITGYDFSFSGLKTAFLYFIRDNTKDNGAFIEEHKADICASIQKTIVDILLNKLKKASAETGIKDIAIAGGVSANSGLRNAVMKMRDELHWNVFIPRFEYCTDNAAMIAIVGYYKYLKGEFSGQDVVPVARMPF